LQLQQFGRKTLSSSFSWVNKSPSYNLKEIENVMSMLHSGKKEKFFSRREK
jgi:hypothetical protein